jgi:NAD(P)-dependent dehydrogenase (short-subunit alcohol dehydrogenase family)
LEEDVAGTLDGKVAVITGAARGIGAATARRMVASGASVVLADIDEAGVVDLAEECGGLAVTTDVTDEDAVRRLIDAALARHGRLDILHNNAVTSRPADTNAVETPDKVWRLTFDVIVMAAVYACRAAIPAMIETGGGAIVNTSSGAASSASGRIAYGTCKGALETFTLYTAGQFGPDGIRCNAVAPGFVRTEGLAGIFTDDQLEEFAGRVAIGRVATPEDIADVVTYLASDEASYVSGQVITINGGGSRVMAW